MIKRTMAGVVVAAIMLWGTTTTAQIRSDVIYGYKDGMALIYDVIHVEKGGLFKPDIDKSGLHTRQNPLHAPLVDIAGNIGTIFPLNKQFHNGAVFLDGNPGLVFCNIYDHSSIHALFLLFSVPGNPGQRAGADAQLDYPGCFYVTGIEIENGVEYIGRSDHFSGICYQAHR